MTTVSIKKTLFNYIWIISCLILLFIVAGAGWFATGYLGDKARQEILEYNESTISLHSSHLTAEFEKIERAVKLLSGSPWIAPALISRKNRDIANANSALDRYNSSMGGSVCYLMDGNGETIASSNRNNSDSFVGKSYQFRPYFTQAIKGAPGRYFALGATSLKRGFYASYPVRDGKGQIAGVVVIKQDVDTEEADLGKYPYCFVVDPNGIIFLSGKKEMNFKSLWPVSREKQLALLKSKQFGEREFDSVLQREVEDGKAITLYGKNYLASRKVINPEGWSIVLMTTTKRVLIYRLAGVIITILICTFITVPFVISYKTSRSAEMVRESEQKFRAVFEQAFQLVGMMTVDGILLSANKAALMLSGVKESDVIGKPFWEAPWWSHSVELQETLRLAVKKAAAGEFVRFDATHPAADGSIRYVDFSLRPVINDAGKVIFLVPEGRDITERKLAEEALLESEKKYRNILENIEDGYYEANIAGNLTFVNNSTCRILGYSADELMDKNNLEYVDDENAKKIFKVYNEVYRTGIPTRAFDWELIRKDGSKCFVETSVSLITDSNNVKTGFSGIARDITDRKRAEDALKESEKKYRFVLEANPDPIIVYDIEGKVVYLNPAFTSVFGWSLEERIGKKMDDFVPEESWLETRIMIDMVLAGKNFSGIETLRLTREGKMVPVSISGSCYRKQEGNIETSVINLRDITERKRVETEKKKIEEQYRQAQKMEAIGQLAGGVAHDFNNMLNIILGYSQMALKNSEPSSPLKANLQEIMNAAQRSAELVRQLLAFARKQIIAPKALDLNDTVAGMLNMLRKLIGEDIDLLWMPAANLWPVKMDPAQVDQILANLSVNARDSISGVGKISIETGMAEFDEAYCAQHKYFIPGHYAMLAVSDNGCGMDKDILEKIFEPFFTTKAVGKGTGMGLATVYGIVKQNDGFINVYSEQGKGTTFKIYLPRFEEKGTAIEKPSALAKPLTGTETVLLVEDEETLLEMGKIMLEELGYTVLATVSPNEAIKLAEQYAGDFHLVVTDVVMPEMSGRDLMKRLNDLRPGIKCLFMSGYTANVIAHRGILDEGVNFLQKPFLMNDLAAKVREAMGKA